MIECATTSPWFTVRLRPVGHARGTDGDADRSGLPWRTHPPLLVSSERFGTLPALRVFFGGLLLLAGLVLACNAYSVTEWWQKHQEVERNIYPSLRGWRLPGSCLGIIGGGSAVAAALVALALA